MSRVFIIHQWFGTPESDWYPWLKSALEKKGVEVLVPRMPDTVHPKIDAWVKTVAEVVGEPRADDVFVTHSIGGQTTLRFLATLDDNQKVGKVIMVAPWFTVSDQAATTKENRETITPWLQTPLDFSKVKEKATLIAIFSDNDIYVPAEDNSKIFKEQLGATILLKKNYGHFTGEEGFDQLPFLLDLV